MKFHTLLLWILWVLFLLFIKFLIVFEKFVAVLIPDINNSLVKHNLETNHNFNFKDSRMLVYIYNKTNIGKMLNLVSFQTTILSNRDQIFYFGQIGAEKLQNLI